MMSAATAAQDNREENVRLVAGYIAGMTERELFSGVLRS
jgi:hypothetical protein